MDDCIFCKIIRGEIPSEKIYEDDAVFALLDIYPITEGMTLAVTKKHVENWWELEDDSLKALMLGAKRTAHALKKVYPHTRIGIQVEGLDVAHVHVKLFPFTDPHEFRAWPNRDVPPDLPHLAQVAEQLRKAVNL